MRDKQAFEAYVLEKSKIEKKKIAMRRKNLLAVGMSLCVCLIALMVLPEILDFGHLSDGTGGVPEGLPEDVLSHATPVPTMGSVVSGTEDGGDGTVGKRETPNPTTPAKTFPKPQATGDKNYGVAALPLDEAFARGKEDYAIPDRINEMTEVAIIRQICDWVMNGDFIEGTQPEKIDCTMTIYYGQDSFVCYIAESGFFKMAEGDWLEADPAYVAMLMDILEES